MKKKENRFSILIPGWNAEPYIENCINSILKNDYNNYSIIIIAGGNDNSFNIALKLQREHPEKILALEQKIPHKNKALNSALNKVDGDIIIITDIDCTYQSRWLKRINEIFQDIKINVITGLYLPFPYRKNSLAEFNNIKMGYYITNFKHAEVIIGNKLCGANAAFRKDIFFNKIGKFEEISKTGDDKILGLQFNEKGENLYFFRDIFVFTECYSNNLIKFVKRRIRWARDLFITLNKKQIIIQLILFIISLFKFLYPITAIIVAISFFNIAYIWIFLLPWVLFYNIYLIRFFINLKEMSIKVNTRLGTSYNYKKAFKIVPLLFFIYGIITIVSLIYPKRHKWYL